MSSINPYFTFNYDQPEDYHFSHDSVFLSRKVYEIIRAEKQSPQAVLDLCAGCGIVGLDFIFHLQNNEYSLPKAVDFLEVQDIYRQHFENNKQRLSAETKCHFLNLNYKDLILQPELKNKYDLILCNPPYFRSGQGSLSDSEFKNRCRFFIDADFQDLLSSISYSLSDTGKAYVLVKSLAVYGLDVELEMKAHNPNLRIKKIDVIRKTDLYEIKKS